MLLEKKKILFFLQIMQTFDPLSENYVAQLPPVRGDMPEWLANAIPNNVVGKRPANY